MKYRIKQVGDKFYPQLKPRWFPIWFELCHNGQATVWCDTIQEAVDRIEDDRKFIPVKIHQIDLWKK